eukprot:UN07094
MIKTSEDQEGPFRIILSGKYKEVIQLRNNIIEKQNDLTSKEIVYIIPISLAPKLSSSVLQSMKSHTGARYHLYKLKGSDTYLLAIRGTKSERSAACTMLEGTFGDQFSNDEYNKLRKKKKKNNSIANHELSPTQSLFKTLAMPDLTLIPDTNPPNQSNNKAYAMTKNKIGTRESKNLINLIMNGKEKAKLYTQNNPLISDTETKENGINIFNGNEKLTLTLYADVSCRDFLIRRSNILDDISEDTGCTITTNRTDESSRSFEIILTGKYENVQKARLKIDEFSSEMKRRTTCVYIDNESYKSMKDQWKIFQSLASNNYNTTVILAKDDQKTGVYVYCVGDLNNRLRALAALDVQIHRDTTVRNQSNALSMQRRREKIRSMKFEDHGIGGLETELKTMVRRAFNSRTISEQLRRELGMQHTKGVLFYGPPGTGKSLIARKLSELLGCNDPKIVNSPEVESKWVGEAEKNIRGLFEDAIKDYEQNGDNAQLHVVIFDELDSIAKGEEVLMQNLETELSIKCCVVWMASMKSIICWYLD